MAPPSRIIFLPPPDKNLIAVIIESGEGNRIVTVDGKFVPEAAVLAIRRGDDDKWALRGVPFEEECRHVLTEV